VRFQVVLLLQSFQQGKSIGNFIVVRLPAEGQVKRLSDLFTRLGARPADDSIGECRSLATREVAVQ
jgi:hypothetical protein